MIQRTVMVLAGWFGSVKIKLNYSNTFIQVI